VQSNMSPWIGDVSACSKHRDCGAAGIQGGAMRRRVDPERHPTDDGRTGAGQGSGNFNRHASAILRGAPRTADRDDPPIQQIQIAVPPEPLRWSREIAKSCRIVLVVNRDDLKRQP